MTAAATIDEAQRIARKVVEAEKGKMGNEFCERAEISNRVCQRIRKRKDAEGAAMIEPDLFSYVPPVILGDRDGETFEPGRDRKRLNKQAQDVFSFMADGRWRILADIAAHTGHPEASISARIRDFRKPRFGGRTVERRYIASGLYQYRLVTA